jgi:hypothetical protein
MAPGGNVHLLAVSPQTPPSRVTPKRARGKTRQSPMVT